MSISASAIFEVRTTGNDANGGFYVSGGTDYSQQDSPQLSLTDVVTNGTTTVTSTTGGFTSAMVGNGVNIAGTLRQITAVGSSTSITVDANVTAGSGQTGKVGGALATIGKATANMVTSNLVWVKAGTGYTISSNFIFTNLSGQNPGVFSRIYGYGTTRGDGTKVSLTLSTGATAGFTSTPTGMEIANFDVDCASIASSVGINVSTSIPGYVHHCRVRNFKSSGISAGFVEFCEVSGGVSGASAAVNAGYLCRNNYIHDSACVGVNTSSALCDFNVIANLTGTTSDAFSIGGGGTAFIQNNTLYSIGRDGVRHAGTPNASHLVRNNIFASCAGYGLNYGSVTPQGVTYPNAYYNNTLGGRSANYAGGFTLPSDVTLTTSPFTAAASGDFSLNSTAGGGAALRGTASPGSFPGSTFTGYLDFGAVQHQDSGGGGTLLGYAGGKAVYA